MEYVNLGNTDIKVSKVCLGCMGFGDVKLIGALGLFFRMEKHNCNIDFIIFNRSYI